MNQNALPVAVIGAGPVGLAAAAELVGRGITPLVFERGPAVGHALRAWGHVRVFSPWSQNIAPAAARLLGETGWSAPEPDTLPTGGEIAAQYLAPLAAHPRLRASIQLNAEVRSIARQGLDKLTDAERTATPFAIEWVDQDGTHQRSLARAVIDCSGTWFAPNPLGVDGRPVPGEGENADTIAYGIPDVLRHARRDYADKRVLVVGSGHSAINAVLDLLALQKQAPGTHVTWALRRNRIERLLGGGLNDKLPARGALGLAAKRAIEEGRLRLLAPFAIDRVKKSCDGVRVFARHDGKAVEFVVDRIITATGFRPNLDMLREIRIALDPAVEAPPALAPLIDPNLHSCGTVPPHGVAELTHPEPGFFIAGAKSYGRAPTFLMLTGYEQVRSIVAEIAGDHAAAREV
ncbi:MAG: NAD(P)-binding domain-containing protein, partial [Rhodospirillaceae bacterium]|nr:NAD(P)-binding domain-containing protein [Rhodospirillaceae bacterium]